MVHGRGNGLGESEREREAALNLGFSPRDVSTERRGEENLVSQIRDPTTTRSQLSWAPQQGREVKTKLLHRTAVVKSGMGKLLFTDHPTVKNRQEGQTT